jgi:ferric-dicitrate binding protein FerR (iron transport regulator)
MAPSGAIDAGKSRVDPPRFNKTAMRNQFSTMNRRALLVGAAGIAFSCDWRPARAAEPVGRVLSALGSTFLARGDAKIKANDGVPLLLHDIAETREASRLELLLGEATHIKLGPMASFEVDSFVRGHTAKSHLDRGAVLVDHGPGSEPEFEVETPYALIGARGTKFWMGPTNGAFGILALSGQVEVSAAGKKVLVAAGMATEVATPATRMMSPQANRAPSPPTIWDKERIRAALSMVE